MAKVKKKSQKTIDSWKKKRWHKIVAPKLFNEQELGKTPALDVNMLMGRTVSTSLMTLTRDMKQSGTTVTFEVHRIQGDTAFTRVKEIEIMPSSIKRLVRRHRDRIEDSFIVTTSDNVKVRIKPFFITKNRTKNSVGTAIRKAVRIDLARIASKTPYESLATDVLSRRLQNGLRSSLNKIYPLRNCEIRKFTLLPGQEVPTTAVQPPAEKKEEPAKPTEAKPEPAKEAAKPEVKPSPVAKKAIEAVETKAEA